MVVEALNACCRKGIGSLRCKLELLRYVGFSLCASSGCVVLFRL